MAKRICYIVGSGINYGIEQVVKGDGYVIAADGGYRYLTEAGREPDLVIGDFDSLGFRPNSSSVIELSSEKDYTDTLAAVYEGIKKGFEVFHIYCGTGGRIDHTLANIQTLKFLSDEGRYGMLFDKDYVIAAVSDGELVFDRSCRGYISVFSFTDESRGVLIKGFRYELEDAVLTNSFALGVSNEFSGKEGVISCRGGTLLVCFPRGLETHAEFRNKKQ